MKLSALLSVALLTLGCHVIRCGPLADGFEPIFDGCTLNGWQGQDMSFWSVEDEAITDDLARARTQTEPVSRLAGRDAG